VICLSLSATHSTRAAPQMSSRTPGTNRRSSTILLCSAWANQAQRSWSGPNEFTPGLCRLKPEGRQGRCVSASPGFDCVVQVVDHSKEPGGLRAVERWIAGRAGRGSLAMGQTTPQPIDMMMNTAGSEAWPAAPARVGLRCGILLPSAG
jgi:hypothetical protein